MHALSYIPLSLSNLSVFLFISYAINLSSLLSQREIVYLFITNSFESTKPCCTCEENLIVCIQAILCHDRDVDHLGVKVLKSSSKVLHLPQSLIRCYPSKTFGT